MAIVILAVVLGFWAADRALSSCFKWLLLQSEFRYSQLFSGASEAEIVIFGNSRGVNGFYSPDLEKAFGEEVNNLSFNGLSAPMVEIMFSEYLNHNPAPEWLWLEVTCLHNTQMNGDVLQLYGSVSERLQQVWFEQEPMLASIQQHVAQTNRFSGEFFLRVLYYYNKSDQSWINRYEIDPKFAQTFRPSSAELRQWEDVDGLGLEAIRKTIELAHAHGVEVKLVVTPYLPSYIEPADGYSSWVQKVENALGMEVIDLSSALDKNEYFADPIHMNLNGFRALQSKLLEALR